MQETSCLVSPIPDHAFFEQPVLQHLLGQRLLQITRLGAKCLHLIAGGLACRIAGKAFLTGFQELLRPTVIKALCDALATAQYRDALLAAQPFKDCEDPFSGSSPVLRCFASSLPWVV